MAATRSESDTSSDRVVLITGAASGMGAACARRFADDHGGVFLLDVRGEALASVARGIEAKVETFVGDVSRPEDVQSAVNTCVARLGRLDVLVNAAGTLEPTRFFDVSWEEWRRVLDVNLTGAFLISQAATRRMEERRWGRIVHFSSTAGKTVSTIGGCHYTVAKHGVLGLTRASAAELAPLGITVTQCAPASSIPRWCVARRCPMIVLATRPGSRSRVSASRRR